MCDGYSCVKRNVTDVLNKYMLKDLQNDEIMLQLPLPKSIEYV